jgi:hypothetical protein
MTGKAELDDAGFLIPVEFKLDLCYIGGLQNAMEKELELKANDIQLQEKMLTV